MLSVTIPPQSRYESSVSLPAVSTSGWTTVRNSKLDRFLVAFAVAGALGTVPALGANQACPPAVAANTGNTLTVGSGATCTINATVNVTSGSTQGATLSGGTTASPTT